MSHRRLTSNEHCLCARQYLVHQTVGVSSIGATRFPRNSSVSSLKKTRDLFNFVHAPGCLQQQLQIFGGANQEVSCLMNLELVKGLRGIADFGRWEDYYPSSRIIALHPVPPPKNCLSQNKEAGCHSPARVSPDALRTPCHPLSDATASNVSLLP